MIKVIEKIKMPIYIQFIIYISIIEVFFSFFFNLLGFQTFQMIPYLRFVIIFFFKFLLIYLHINIINIIFCLAEHISYR